MKKLTPVQIRELISIRDDGKFLKCSARTFNGLYSNGLIRSIQNGIGLTSKAFNLL